MQNGDVLRFHGLHRRVLGQVGRFRAALRQDASAGPSPGAHPHRTDLLPEVPPAGPVACWGHVGVGVAAMTRDVAARPGDGRGVEATVDGERYSRDLRHMFRARHYGLNSVNR
jgi:hypothetical protein